MKIAIVGTRTFNDYEKFKRKVDRYFSKNVVSEIVSGGAKGTDEMAERYAKENNIPIKIFHAEWNKYGKSAGPLRNKEIAKYCDRAIAFWDEKSPGTKNVIKECLNENKRTKLIKISKNSSE